MYIMYVLVSPQMIILKRDGEIYPPTHQEAQVISTHLLTAHNNVKI